MIRLRTFLLLLFASFLLIACSRTPEQEPSAAGQDAHPGHAVVEQSKPAVVADNITPEPLQVINRPHYHTVEIRQMKFIPAELVINAGDTVVWINNGITAHDVTEVASKRWTSSSMAVGATWSKVVTESAEYFCSIHVVMKGKLVVE